jgi:capsular exopolysaccharide synthesis family protein
MMIKHKNDHRINNDEIDLSWFVNELSLHRMWYIAALAIALMAGVAYIKVTPEVYEASCSILIREGNKQSVDINDFVAGDLFGDQANIATEIGILESRAVMSETIRELELEISYVDVSSYPKSGMYRDHPFLVIPDSGKDWHDSFRDIPFSVTLAEGDRYVLFVEADDDDDVEDYSYETEASWGEPVETPYFSFRLIRNPDADHNPDHDDYEFIYNSKDRQVNEYLSRLRVETPDKDASIVRLHFRDRLSERARDVLNTLSEVYIDLDVEDKTSVASLTLQFVDEQLQRTTDVVDKIESELQEFKESNKTVNLTEESRSILEKANTIEVEKRKSDIELASLDNLLDYVTSNRDMTELAPSTLGIPDPLLVELIINYQELQSKRNSLSYGVKNATPAVKIIDQQIADTRASLIENIKSIKRNLELTNRALSSQLSGYESQIRQMPEVERQFLSIQRRFEVNQNIYIYLLQKKAETSIAKAAAISDNKVLDEAVLAEDPVEPDKKIVMSLLLMCGLLFPTLLIFFKQFFRTTISGRDEISKMTEIPILGAVGHSPKADNLVVHHRPKSGIAESFRSIRTNLQFLGRQGKNKVILITSSVGGEGKSFVTINLACVLAMQNRKVVIVGVDLRKPKLFGDFGLSNNKGVSSYLIGQSDIQGIVQHTNIENLDIIPSGPIPPNPSELVSKNEMAKLFDELSSMYDHIVVDTPPLGIVSDAMILMNYSHVNVYIVRENYSRKEYVQTLNENYEQGKFNNMSIILNDSGLNGTYGNSYGYSYGYHSGSGYYDDDDGSISAKVKRKIFNK